MESEQSKILQSTLMELVGRQLTSVVFIHDYLQLIFDGPCLTALNVPRVCYLGSILEMGDKGFCDALCAQIGRIVETIAVQDQELTISIESGAKLRISMREADYAGPEAINYISEDGRWLVV